MKKLIYLVFLLFGAIAFPSNGQAQLSNHFASEIHAFLEADIQQAKRGERKEKLASIPKYEVSLEIEGFDVYCKELITAVSLNATYKQPGSANTMDSIYEALNTLPYLVFDSKYKPQILNKKDDVIVYVRKIKILSTLNAKTLATVALDEWNNLTIIRYVSNP